MPEHFFDNRRRNILLERAFDFVPIVERNPALKAESDDVIQADSGFQRRQIEPKILRGEEILPDAKHRRRAEQHDRRIAPERPFMKEQQPRQRSHAHNHQQRPFRRNFS